MARFHSLQVADVKQETVDAIVVSFNIPAELREEFGFVHGQYLTLKLTVNGEELRRSYSICSSPLDRESIRIAVKKVAGGRASTQLVEKLKPGMTLDVMTPMGNFTTALDPAHAKHYVAFAAGSGITPILSILKTVLRSEPRSRFTLFYGNTDVDRILFRERLAELKAHWADRLDVHHILTKGVDEDRLFNGRITGDKARELLGRFVTDLTRDKEFFICGPEQMMVNVSEALEKMGADKKRIHIELFTTVLDAALDAGLDVPYACKGAVCCTCKARVLEGKVEMDMNYALTDDEVADGYVLTCQARPRSARVVIDYDQH